MMSEYDTFISIILRGQEGRRGVEQAPLEDGIQETVFDVPPEHIIQSSSGRGWNGLDVAGMLTTARPSVQVDVNALAFLRLLPLHQL